MLDPFAAVLVYSTDPEPVYCIIAHNLNSKWDAIRLRDRLKTQYELNAYVVFHRNHHDINKAEECDVCSLLVEEIIEKAAGYARSKAANTV